MDSATTVTIHASRYPGRARAAYLQSFRSRRMNHQFHYDTEKQAQQWLALHEAYSPARTDQDCLQTYARAFEAMNELMPSEPANVVSLGCGGGQKDSELIKALKNRRNVSYYPMDVSLPLALTAHLAVPNSVRPCVLDLPAAENLPAFFDETISTNGPRIIAFFGMLPNFEASEVLPKLSTSLRPDDYLLLSANLAPGPDYAPGVEKILPLYDNDLTRRWLSTVFIDAGLEIDPNDLEFKIAQVADLRRIEAGYCFRKQQSIRLDGGEFTYKPGDWFQLFFSYRHTSALLRDLFAPYQIEIVRQWIIPSEEEGIFLGRILK